MVINVDDLQLILLDKGLEIGVKWRRDEWLAKLLPWLSEHLGSRIIEDLYNWNDFKSPKEAIVSLFG